MDTKYREMADNRKPFLKKILVTLSLIFVLFSVPPVAKAASLFFETSQESIQIGQTFAVQVFLATDDRSINAVQADIRFPADRLRLQEIRDGGSLINLWLRKPVSDSGKVYFSGLIPGGYAGRMGYLFTLVFQVRRSGPATIESSNERLLLNDGRGTRARIRREPLTIQVGQDVSDTDFALAEDTDPPETFTPVLAREEHTFDGKWFLAFTAEDKGVGLARYEVAEQRGLFQPKMVTWSVAENPYLLTDQDRRSWVLVKAVDKRGNERVAVVQPANRTLGLVILTALVVAGMVVLSIGVARLRRKRRKYARRSR